jgi:hypothetical protein
MKKKILTLLTVLALVSCIRQTINTETTFVENHSFDEVWAASIKAVNDIDFTTDSMDIQAGFISAESGTHLLQDAPPRLSIMIREYDNKISLRCRVLQKEQYVDLLGLGRKTLNKFLAALNLNLNR